MYRTLPLDCVFVLDASASTEHFWRALTDGILDAAFKIHICHRDLLDFYGAVAYRDRVDNPEDRYQFWQLHERRDALEEWFGTITCSGGGDDPEDWVGALDIALHRLQWRNGGTYIYWSADANAHGRRFTGNPRDPHNDQEAPLEQLVQEMARRKIHFRGFNIRTGRDPGCAQTLAELKRIYEAAGGPSFKVYEVPFVRGDEGYDSLNWPPSDDWVPLREPL
jgi:hypothetical protein